MKKKTANQNKIYYLSCEFELCILTQLFFVELELDLVVSWLNFEVDLNFIKTR